LDLARRGAFIPADATARFADTHGKWGLVGAWGMTQRLPRRIGTAAAKRMMMTARGVEAAEAEELGLVDILVPEGALEQSIGDLAAELLANSWFTNFSTQRLMIETDGMSLAGGLAHEHYRYPGGAPGPRERIDRSRRRSAAEPNDVDREDHGGRLGVAAPRRGPLPTASAGSPPPSRSACRSDPRRRHRPLRAGERRAAGS